MNIIKNCKDCELSSDSCNCICLDLAAAPPVHSVPAVESRPSVPHTSAFVLVLPAAAGFRHRYFCGFGKNKRLKTAWSLAGARLFLFDSKEQTNSGSEMVNAEFNIALKGIKCERRVVSLEAAQ